MNRWRLRKNRQPRRGEPAYAGDNVREAAAAHPASAADKADGRRITPLDGVFAGFGEGISRVSALLSRFLTGGNPVLKIGIVILFFGVAFLLKYAAQRNLVPLEFRLIGVALGGLALLATGWQLRQRTLGYGLILQGGGIGILYLVVYAAARLYHFLPLTLSLAVMIALVVLSSFLAVLQESKSLAVAGLIGGFLAPVLMSTGGGSHVLLFSYYALLNLGILGIAWFKSWRELNLLGFVFTFAIATVWGYNAYQPENFSTTEPFLLFFFLLYVTVSVLFAHRQPLNLRGFIDGPLVFGLPLVVSVPAVLSGAGPGVRHGDQRPRPRPVLHPAGDPALAPVGRRHADADRGLPRPCRRLRQPGDSPGLRRPVDVGDLGPGRGGHGLGGGAAAAALGPASSPFCCSSAPPSFFWTESGIPLAPRPFSTVISSAA